MNECIVYCTHNIASDECPQVSACLCHSLLHFRFLLLFYLGISLSCYYLSMKYETNHIISHLRITWQRSLVQWLAVSHGESCKGHAIALLNSLLSVQAMQFACCLHYT